MVLMLVWAAAAAVPSAPSLTPSAAVLDVLVALAAVLAVGQLLGRLCARVSQPPVIGEVIGGILLGPSVLGRIAPNIGHMVLPGEVGPILNQLAQLGAVLYMFLVGIELDFEFVRARANSTIAIALAGIAVPFAAGAAFALALFPFGASVGISLATYASFLGVALSVTAFPVLARILADSGIQRTELGRLALACAAMADVTAWCLLALVIGAAQASLAHAAGTIALTGVFVILMLTVARPLLAHLGAQTQTLVSRSRLAWLLVAVLLSAATTEALGVHAIFGAFLLGTLIPTGTPLARSLIGRLEDVVTTLLLPAFFAVTGLRMQMSLISGPAEWAVLLVLIVVASAGKIGGTTLAARIRGQDWRTALGLGILMNTRGLMELIVLNIGLDLGIISPTLFAVLVLMAIATTVATGPALSLLGIWTRHRTATLASRVDPG